MIPSTESLPIEIEKIEKEIFDLTQKRYQISDTVTGLEQEGKTILEELAVYEKLKVTFGDIDADGQRKSVDKQNRLIKVQELIEQKEKEISALNDDIFGKERRVDGLRRDAELQAAVTENDRLIFYVRNIESRFDKLCAELVSHMAEYAAGYEGVLTEINSIKRHLEAAGISPHSLTPMPAKCDHMIHVTALKQHLEDLLRKRKGALA